MGVEAFDKSQRLLVSADYSYVFDQASHKVSHRHYLVLAREKNQGPARLGLVVSKKNVRLAARRNRVKRVVRETFRRRTCSLDSLDIVFLARKGFDTLSPSDQSQLMAQAWERLAKRTGGRP